MKTFLVYIGGLLAVTVLFLGASEWFNRRLIFASSGSDPYKRYRLFVQHPEDEIPILGSSRAEGCIAPAELSPKAFNYGLSGLAMRETTLHLQAVLNRKTPTRVIVNLDPWGLTSGTFRGDYRFATSAPEVQNEPLARPKGLDLIPGVRFHGQTRANLAQYINDRFAGTKTVEAGAILLRISRTKTEWEYMISSYTVQPFSIDIDTRERLQALLEQNTRHEVIFVVAPVSPPWLEKFVAQRELDELKAWLQQHPHVKVLDYLRTIPRYTLEDFVDLTHLNEQAARRFTRQLKRDLL